jgi:hypothetical protein
MASQSDHISSIETIRVLPGILNVWHNIPVAVDEPLPSLKCRSGGKAKIINSTVYQTTSVDNMRVIQCKGASIAVVDLSFNYNHTVSLFGMGRLMDGSQIATPKYKMLVPCSKSYRES